MSPPQQATQHDLTVRSYVGAELFSPSTSIGLSAAPSVRLIV